MNQNLVDDLKALDMLNERLAHLLTKIMNRYTKADILETASALQISGISPHAQKWEILKHILCNVGDDAWLLS
jgi:hypothetical protein